MGSIKNGLKSFERLCKILNKEKKENAESYLAVDYVPMYGGSRIVIVDKSNGSHSSWFFKKERLRPKEFCAYIDGIIDGLLISKENSAN